MPLLSFFNLLVSPRGLGSYNYFALLKVAFFLSSMSFHEKYLQSPTSLTYCNEASK